MDFLLEIGCEEIPARMLAEAEAVLGARVAKLLAEQKLDAGNAKTTTYSTPRRLAVLCSGLLASQEDVHQQLTGPAVNIGFKDGTPTPAAHAFAKKAGVDVSALERIKTPKGEYLAAKVVSKGRSAAQVLAEALPEVIGGLHWPKAMYWRAGAPERFVRPVRWLVALLDSEVVPLEFAGVRAGAKSRGHRILSEGAAAISSPAQYKDALAAARVLADPKEREQKIRKALDELTRSVSGARWREDAALLATVVSLTEFPSAVLGNFDREFLALPEEVLVTVMRDHQKYFAVDDASGKLAPHFLAVLNTEGDPDGLIRHGNERVLRARFNDARFFWETDQKVPLKQRVEMLKHVTFQKELGSYYEKTKRVVGLANTVAADLAKAGFKIDCDAVREAAWLAKTDLTTELVKEFTELQGIVGGLYAKAQKHPAAVADAIYDHYKPESMEEAVARTNEGAVLSIADKADSIAGMFALGKLPTGSRDPFALRRQANGIVKTIAEHRLPIGIKLLFESAGRVYREVPIVYRTEGNASEGLRDSAALDYGMPTMPTPEFMRNVAAFMRERLGFYLREVLGCSYDVVNTVMAVGTHSFTVQQPSNAHSDLGPVKTVGDEPIIRDAEDDVPGTLDRAEAFKKAKEWEDFRSISIAFKRTKNILVQASEKGFEVGPFDGMLSTPEEVRLYSDIDETGAGFGEDVRNHRFTEALMKMVSLRPKIDAYFDSVMVMVDDAATRRSRLGLIYKLYFLFSSIGDISEIVTEGKG
jgi:glycyl-tRNA synthetase beta chain